MEIQIQAKNKQVQELNARVQKLEADLSHLECDAGNKEKMMTQCKAECAKLKTETEHLQSKVD